MRDSSYGLLNMTDIIQLHGHSGCNISIHRSANDVFVRKSSNTVNYNDRLIKQRIKQAAYQNSSLFTPRVLRDGYQGDKYYFDMEYIKGETLAHLIAGAPANLIDYYIRKIVDSFNFDNKVNIAAQSIFLEKIKSTEEKIIEHEYYNHKTIKDAIRCCMNTDFSGVPTSECHGDLTLENIIISNDTIYLIDFLDSFYDSWMIDVAKLMQDIVLGWSFRLSENNSNIRPRLIAAQASLSNILNEQGIDDRQLQLIHNILKLNLLRILPYTSDTPTLKFIIRSLNFLQDRK